MSLSSAVSVAAARPVRLPVVLWVIALGVAVRLAVAAIVGPNVDETYIAVISRTPALGYVDHPPMAMWLAAAMRWLTGSESIFLLRLPFIALSAGTAWLIYRLGVLLFGEAAALLGVLALSLTPLICVYFGSFVLTDGPVVFFMAAAALSVAYALFDATGRRATLWWLAAGVLLGLAMLSKYTAVFLVFGVGLYLVTQPDHRRWLLRPAPWLALLVAALVFSPVIIWNARHGWISFAFQGDRALPGLTLQPVRLVVDLAIQAVFVLPPIWVGLMITLGRGLAGGPSQPRSWFATALGIGPIAFFALVWLVARQGNHGFHWAGPGYLMLYPLYGLFLVERARLRPREVAGWFVASAAVFGVVLIGYLGHALTGWGQVFMADRSANDPVLVDQVDWHELRGALAQRGLLDPQDNYVLAVGWPQCVRADYGLGGAMPVVCEAQKLLLSVEKSAGIRGKDAIIVSLTPRQQEVSAAVGPRFAALQPLGPVAITSHGVHAATLWLFLGRPVPAP